MAIERTLTLSDGTVVRGVFCMACCIKILNGKLIPKETK